MSDIGFNAHDAHQNAGDGVEQYTSGIIGILTGARQKAAGMSDLFRVERRNGLEQHFRKYQHHERQSPVWQHTSPLQAHTHDGAGAGSEY